jgi:hypothetical protein
MGGPERAPLDEQCARQAPAGALTPVRLLDAAVRAGGLRVVVAANPFALFAGNPPRSVRRPPAQPGRHRLQSAHPAGAKDTAGRLAVSPATIFISRNGGWRINCKSDTGAPPRGRPGRSEKHRNPAGPARPKPVKAGSCLHPPGAGCRPAAGAPESRVSFRLLCDSPPNARLDTAPSAPENSRGKSRRSAPLQLRRCPWHATTAKGRGRTSTGAGT